MGTKAVKEGHETAVTIVSDDDYLMLLATSFNIFFTEAGGTSIGSLTIDPGEDSYLDQLEVIHDQGADMVVMMVYPPTGATLTEECLITGNKGAWYLAPTLHTDMFLKNVPFGALEGFNVFSPSLSQAGECELQDDQDTGAGGMHGGLLHLVSLR
jgi:ABC-type branched-subunit amino acid transport system substrate-binding protein